MYPRHSGSNEFDIRGIQRQRVGFINTDDHYGSGGRKALQIFAALGGVSVTSGVHKGHAGLIDLKTGELVWLNADLQMGGDVRTLEGAQKRVRQLLEGFPGRPVQAATATEGVRLEFTEDGVQKIAQIAFSVNETTENIGARRLSTVMEKLLEDVSFGAEDRQGETLIVDAAYVDAQLASVARNTDLSKYVL